MPAGLACRVERRSVARPTQAVQSAEPCERFEVCCFLDDTPDIRRRARLRQTCAERSCYALKTSVCAKIHAKLYVTSCYTQRPAGRCPLPRREGTKSWILARSQMRGLRNEEPWTEASPSIAPRVQGKEQRRSAANHKPRGDHISTPIAEGERDPSECRCARQGHECPMARHAQRSMQHGSSGPDCHNKRRAWRQPTCCHLFAPQQRREHAESTTNFRTRAVQNACPNGTRPNISCVVDVTRHLSGHGSNRIAIPANPTPDTLQWRYPWGEHHFQSEASKRADIS